MNCLNLKCTYKKLTNYDCVCPKCGMDLYYKFHYGVDMFVAKDESELNTQRRIEK